MNYEVIQFIGALLFLVCIMVGSYWFVYAPVKRENERQVQKNRESS